MEENQKRNIKTIITTLIALVAILTIILIVVLVKGNSKNVSDAKYELARLYNAACQVYVNNFSYTWHSDVTQDPEVITINENQYIEVPNYELDMKRIFSKDFREKVENELQNPERLTTGNTPIGEEGTIVKRNGKTYIPYQDKNISAPYIVVDFEIKDKKADRIDSIAKVEFLVDEERSLKETQKTKLADDTYAIYQFYDFSIIKENGKWVIDNFKLPFYAYLTQK